MGSEQIRVDAGLLRQDRIEAVQEWVRSLGEKPEDVRGTFLIVRGEREWELHLSRFRRDDRGKIVVDQATNSAVTDPVVIGIGTARNWPDFTGGESA